MHYYQHHIGDYRKDTSHLSLLEHGAYRQLLDWYYLDESPIPKETQVVMRRLSAKTQMEIDAVNSVLSDFFELSEDGYRHKRCDQEIAIYTGKAEKNRENGKLGGRPTTKKPTETQVVSERLAKITLTNNHKPITNNQEPDNTMFDNFWKMYPKKVGKVNALKAWNKLKVDENTYLLIKQSIDKQKTSDQWSKNNGLFIPHPATWLNGRRWEDESEDNARPWEL